MQTCTPNPGAGWPAYSEQRLPVRRLDMPHWDTAEISTARPRCKVGELYAETFCTVNCALIASARKLRFLCVCVCLSVCLCACLTGSSPTRFPVLGEACSRNGLAPGLLEPVEEEEEGGGSCVRDQARVCGVQGARVQIVVISAGTVRDNHSSVDVRRV